MNYLVVDFETFTDYENGYGLGKSQGDLSITEYVRDNRFRVHGCGFRWLEQSATHWMSNDRFLRTSQVDQTAIIAHNAKFDGAILAWRYGVKPAAWIDTKAMAQAVLGGQVPDFSLRTLAKYYGLPEKGDLEKLDIDGKTELTKEEEEALSSYCMRDVEITAQLFEKLKAEFPESQYWHMNWTIRNFVEPRLVLNTQLLEKTNKEEAARRAAFFTRPGYEKTKFASNKQFPELLAAAGFKVPTKKSPTTGERIPALALGDQEFREMLKSTDTKLRELCEARVAAKSTLLETRSAKLAAISKTGPWPFDVNFSGAVQTHRYSGGRGAGGNPQNFPQGSALRQAVEAPAGHALLVADLSAIERRIQGWLACDQATIKAYEKGTNLYAEFASRYYGRPVTKESNLKFYKFGKCAQLGLGYSMGAKKFMLSVEKETGQKLSYFQAKKAVDLFRTTYSGIVNYWGYLDRVLGEIASGKAGKLNGLQIVTYDKLGFTLPSGLKLKYPNLRREEDEWLYDEWQKKSSPTAVKIYGGKVFENLCQAIAGEILKDIIWRLEILGYRVDAQIHDEIIAVLPASQALPVQSVFEAAMATPPAWWEDIKIKGECGVGKNWLDAKR